MDIGITDEVGIHYLPPDKVVADLDKFRSEIDSFWPDLPHYTA
jgi:hypothetical protein